MKFRASPDQVMTVLGPVPPESLSVTDAHNHIWIAPVQGATPGNPVLFDQLIISAELGDYRQAGGGTEIDCQPGGCGRDGRVLTELSRLSGVHIVACTGFHLNKYYPLDYWLWRASSDDAHAFFVSELTQGLSETVQSATPVRAGFIKIACEATLGATSLGLLQAAALASQETGAAMEIHTERGACAEEIVKLFASYQVAPERLVLCHMDKRPDHTLHRSLAQAGVMLEYDTFYRRNYQPDRHVWRLLEQMVADGFERQIAIGTDMAETALWSRFGKGPGLVGLPRQIVPRLEAMGFPSPTIRRLAGQNIVHRLARPMHSPFTKEFD